MFLVVLMNKKGTIITYLPFKKYVILIIIGIVIYLIYFWHLTGGSFSDIIPISKTCPENIIPERMILRCGRDSNALSSSSTCTEFLARYIDGQWKSAKWKDGMSAGTRYGSGCHLGYKEGENLSNIYCKDMQYSSTPIINGIVQKEINYKIDLILDSTDDNNDGYKILKVVCK